MVADIARAGVGLVSKCKACKGDYTRLRPLQTACSPACAQALAEAKRTKAEAKARREDKAATRAKLAEMEGLPKLKTKAKISFNAWVRARDAGRGCISCGVTLGAGAVGGGFDAGHYRSVGSAPHLRFDERNVHGQCKDCNRRLHSNPTGYRLGLIGRIGLSEVEALERDQVGPGKMSRDDLIRLATEYRAKARAIVKNR